MPSYTRYVDYWSHETTTLVAKLIFADINFLLLTCLSYANLSLWMGGDMGKKLLIGHQSALLVYRAAGAGLLAKPERYTGAVYRTDYSTKVSAYLESSNLQSIIRSCELDILVLDEARRHKSPLCRMHSMRGEVPEGSFWTMGMDILVASPELTFLQMCQDLHNKSSYNRMKWCHELIDEFGEFGRLAACAEICSELCGIYSISPSEGAELKRHAAFTSHDSICRYLEQSQHRNYLRLARKAAHMASPLSASPRETAVFLVMTSPWPIGYGFELPATNELVLPDGQDLSDDKTLESVRFSDYSWPRKKLRNGRVRKPVTLEYDSDEHHTMGAGLTDKQVQEQNERRDSIEAAGNGFLRLTTQHTKSFDDFDEKMRQLARLLRVDLPDRSSEEQERAERFQEIIFDTQRFKLMEQFKSAE